MKWSSQSYLFEKSIIEYLDGLVGTISIHIFWEFQEVRREEIFLIEIDFGSLFCRCIDWYQLQKEQNTIEKNVNVVHLIILIAYQLVELPTYERWKKFLPIVSLTLFAAVSYRTTNGTAHHLPTPETIKADWKSLSSVRVNCKRIAKTNLFTCHYDNYFKSYQLYNYVLQVLYRESPVNLLRISTHPPQGLEIPHYCYRTFSQKYTAEATKSAMGQSTEIRHIFGSPLLPLFSFSPGEPCTQVFVLYQRYASVPFLRRLSWI